MSSSRQIDSADQLSPDDLSAVRSLVAAARTADGIAPLNEHSTLQLQGTVAGVVHLIARTDGKVAGYAQVELARAAGDDTVSGATASMELVVAPSQRRRGVGTELVDAALAQARNRPMLAWAHGTTAAATALAARTGFLAVRSLLEMGRALDAVDDLPTPPAGIRVRTFVPGQDEDAWLAVNAAAFAHHPEQGGWTSDDLDAREAESWFDPAGFFLAETVTTPPRLVGFHWTKVEGDSGEVYVVGIDPSAQGGGLGKLLLLTGLRHLKERGCTHVDLYVEADNVAARALYERRGFGVEVTDTMFRREP